MRALRILQLDSGGEKYLALARSIADKGAPYQVTRLPLPDGTLYVHCFDSFATVRIEILAGAGFWWAISTYIALDPDLYETDIQQAQFQADTATWTFGFNANATSTVAVIKSTATSDSAATAFWASELENRPDSDAAGNTASNAMSGGTYAWDKFAKPLVQLEGGVLHVANSYTDAVDYTVALERWDSVSKAWLTAQTETLAGIGSFSSTTELRTDFNGTNTLVAITDTTSGNIELRTYVDGVLDQTYDTGSSSGSAVPLGGYIREDGTYHVRWFRYISSASGSIVDVTESGTSSAAAPIDFTAFDSAIVGSYASVNSDRTAGCFGYTFGSYDASTGGGLTGTGEFSLYDHDVVNEAEFEYSHTYDTSITSAGINDDWAAMQEFIQRFSCVRCASAGGVHVTVRPWRPADATFDPDYGLGLLVRFYSGVTYLGDTKIELADLSDPPLSSAHLLSEAEDQAWVDLRLTQDGSTYTLRLAYTGGAGTQARLFQGEFTVSDVPAMTISETGGVWDNVLTQQPTDTGVTAYGVIHG